MKGASPAVSEVYNRGLWSKGIKVNSKEQLSVMRQLENLDIA